LAPFAPQQGLKEPKLCRLSADYMPEKTAETKYPVIVRDAE
jgi:hypothetical protein